MVWWLRSTESVILIRARQRSKVAGSFIFTIFGFPDPFSK